MVTVISGPASGPSKIFYFCPTSKIVKVADNKHREAFNFVKRDRHGKGLSL